jgi:hypothetical protein
MTAPAVFYDVASSRLQEQLDRINALDSKASTALGFSSALLPIFGVFFGVATNHPKLATIAYGVALAIYLALVVVAGLAYRVASWNFRPDLTTLEKHSQSRSESDVRMWAAQECVRSIDKNEPRLKRKGRYVKLALSLLAMDAAVLSVAALATLS